MTAARGCKPLAAINVYTISCIVVCIKVSIQPILGPSLRKEGNHRFNYTISCSINLMGGNLSASGVCHGF